MPARSLLRLLALVVSLALAAAFGPSVTTATAGESPPPRDPVKTLMKKMSLREKVGQLFVIEVAGRDANFVSNQAKATNQELYGVDTPARSFARSSLNGIPLSSRGSGGRRL